MKMKKERLSVQQQSVPVGSEKLKRFWWSGVDRGKTLEKRYGCRVNLGRVLHLYNLLSCHSAGVLQMRCCAYCQDVFLPLFFSYPDCFWLSGTVFLVCIVLIYTGQFDTDLQSKMWISCMTYDWWLWNYNIWTRNFFRTLTNIWRSYEQAYFRLRYYNVRCNNNSAKKLIIHHSLNFFS